MAASRRTLKSAFIDGSKLKTRVRDGMQAMKTSDFSLIAPTERQKIVDSLDLDEAMTADLPNANRWDYLIFVRPTNSIVAIEPHSARDSEISVVIAKKRQAAAFLRDHFTPGSKVSNWFWVSHGRVKFSAMERARRHLDQNGISFEGHMLRSLG